MTASDLIQEIQKVRVIPVIDPKSQDETLIIIDALISGGAKVIEITLRSDVAFTLLPICRKSYPDIIIGAGSVMSPEIYDQVVSFGADFTISPGRCMILEEHCAKHNIAHIPGVTTPTEIISARRAGHKLLKFYPSEPSGGASTLKDLGRIFPNIMMMPSGSIKEEMLAQYAQISTILSVGGSWMYTQNGSYRSAEDIRQTMENSIKVMCG